MYKLEVRYPSGHRRHWGLGALWSTWPEVGEVHTALEVSDLQPTLKGMGLEIRVRRGEG